MYKGILFIVVLALMIGSTVFAYGIVTGATRSDCPGKITCPLTGEEVCKDRCPLLDANRADCPGKVECPLTGELVCKDECPLGEANETAPRVPDCCRNAK